MDADFMRDFFGMRRRRGEAAFRDLLKPMEGAPDGAILRDIMADLRRMEEKRTPRPPPEKEIAELRVFADRYGKAAERFKVGQIVTRSAGTACHGAGWPALVLEVLAEPVSNFYLDSKAEPTRDADYGARYDMRVLHQDSAGVPHAHWVESWTFEPFKAPTGKRAHG